MLEVLYKSVIKMEIQIGNVKVVYDDDTTKIITVTDDVGVLDFTNSEAVYPSDLYYGSDGIRIVNTYALDQQVLVGWRDNLTVMLMEYLNSPAVSYRIIHNIVCGESMDKMRKIIGTYVSHLGRTDSASAREWVTMYLRALTTVGNKQIADSLTDAINSDNQLTNFVNTLRPLLKPEIVVMNYTKYLEICFGKIDRDKLTYKLLQSIPLKHVNTREATPSVIDWALEHNLILPEQAKYSN